MIIKETVGPVERFETRDGTLHETRKDAILYEIDECIAKDPDYYHINSKGYLDISFKEDMVHFIRNNPEIVRYILNDPTN